MPDQSDTRATSPYAGAPDRPVFVGACPRSGTTLLRTMLNSHPGLAVPRETRFLLGAWERRAVFGDLRRSGNRRKVAHWIAERKDSGFKRLKVPADALANRLENAPPTIGSLLGACFEMYAEGQGKKRWGDKRPIYAQHLDAVFAMFADAQFVNLVRDPRAAVASTRKLGWYDGDIVPAVDLWARSVRAAESWRGRLAVDQFHQVRYEDLVADPRGVLEGIATFAGLDPEGVSSMLSFYENSDLPPSKKYHPLVSSPVTTATTRAWQEQLGPDEVAFVEHALGPTMQRYGYERVAAGVTPPRDMQQRYTRVRRDQTRRRVRERLYETKLRLTYRYPVAAER
ncbi:MAG: sulfotransferase family protein [Actinomycetes bacterium]